MPKTCPQCQSIHSGVAVRCECGCDLSRVASEGPIAIPLPTAPAPRPGGTGLAAWRRPPGFALLYAGILLGAWGLFPQLQTKQGQYQRTLHAEILHARGDAAMVSRGEKFMTPSWDYDRLEKYAPDAKVEWAYIAGGLLAFVVGGHLAFPRTVAGSSRTPPAATG